MKKILTLLFLVPFLVFGQTATVTKTPGTNAIKEDLVFGSGRTLTLNGALAGTPTGGTLNLSSVTLNGGALSGTFSGNPTFSGNLTGSGTGVHQFSGTVRVSGAIDTASSGALSLKLGRFAGSPSNATDAFIGINDSPGPGAIAGDLIYIPRTTSGVAAAHRWYGNASGTLTERMSLSYVGDLAVSSTNVGHTFTRTGLNGAGAASVISFVTDAATANDELGFTFIAKDSGAVAQTYGSIRAKITDATAGSEDGAVVVFATTAGSALTQAASFSGVGSSLKGTTSNNNAATGDVGEYLSSTVESGSAVSLTSATPANITSLSLTAGDWDVDGVVYFVGTLTGGYSAVSLNTNSATISGSAGLFAESPTMPTATSRATLIHPARRLSVASTTTIYLAAQINYSVGTATAFGQVCARRVR